MPNSGWKYGAGFALREYRWGLRVTTQSAVALNPRYRKWRRNRPLCDTPKAWARSITGLPPLRNGLAGPPWWRRNGMIA